ncbi:MAG: VOC family protein [Salinisphaera sp.]|jgi:catechol 2,3-dioxygenase-like lactoylglutathione lyase family enzyme|nr:VOC family protein [Salinisphaera sp.]
MVALNKPRLVGINHVALEVGDVAAAVQFYGAVFDFKLRGSHENDAGRLTMAFLDMGDQFLALSEGRRQKADDGRHFGLVVDDRSQVKALAIAAGGTLVDGPFVDFRDPWGNRVEVVDYRDVQYLKPKALLNALGVSADKSGSAKEELREKGVEL